MCIARESKSSMRHYCLREGANVTDGLMMDRTTSVPKSVLRYVVDKVRSLDPNLVLHNKACSRERVKCILLFLIFSQDSI